MAQLLCPNVHEKVLSGGVVAIEPLNRILHRSGKFAIGAAKLLKEHVSEVRSGSSTRTVYISLLTWWYMEKFLRVGPSSRLQATGASHRLEAIHCKSVPSKCTVAAPGREFLHVDISIFGLTSGHEYATPSNTVAQRSLTRLKCQNIVRRA